MFHLSEIKKRQGDVIDPIRAKRLMTRIKKYITNLARDPIGLMSPDHLESVRDDADEYEYGNGSKPSQTMLSALIPALQGEDLPRLEVHDGAPTITVESSEELEKVCTPSGFGDLKTATTKVDPAVRKSLESTDHPLIAVTLEAYAEEIRAMASNVFSVPKETVVVVPKKLLLYLQGGKFAKHVDTPPVRPNHLGTAVVDLRTPRFDEWGTGGRLNVGGTYVVGGVCVFAPDVPHERTKVKEGFRVSVTFELFHDGKTPPPTEEDAKYVAALQAEPAPFGFVLENSYSLNQAIYGEADLQAVRLLEAAGIEYVRMPIVIDYDYRRTSDGEEVESAAVYDVTGFDKPPKWVKDVTFYPLDSSYVELDRQVAEGAEYTGNESRDTTLEMRYFATALVCKPAEPAAEPAAAAAEPAAE
jgi:hypothetical protein